jgi:hypothetical protein
MRPYLEKKTLHKNRACIVAQAPIPQKKKKERKKNPYNQTTKKQTTQLKNDQRARNWWFMPVIQAIQ